MMGFKQMDFDGLKRKELQALCKKHSIPANVTNVEMAKRLRALVTVEEKAGGLKRTVLKSSNEKESENKSDFENRQPKKVRFDLVNQMFEFEKSEVKYIDNVGSSESGNGDHRRLTRRSLRNKKVEVDRMGETENLVDGSNKIIVEIDEEVVERDRESLNAQPEKVIRRSMRNAAHIENPKVLPKRSSEFEKSEVKYIGNLGSSESGNGDHRGLTRRSLRNKKVEDDRMGETENLVDGSNKSTVETDEEVVVERDRESLNAQPEKVIRRSTRNAAHVENPKLLPKRSSKAEAVDRGKSRNMITATRTNGSEAEKDVNTVAKTGLSAGENPGRSKRHASTKEPLVTLNNLDSQRTGRKEARKQIMLPVKEAKEVPSVGENLRRSKRHEAAATNGKQEAKKRRRGPNVQEESEKSIKTRKEKKNSKNSQKEDETEGPSLEAKDSFPEDVAIEKSSFYIELTTPEHGLSTGEKKRSESPSGHGLSIILDGVERDTYKNLEGSSIQRSETEEPSIEAKNSFPEGVAIEQSSIFIESIIPEHVPIGEKMRSESPSGPEPSIILDSVEGDTDKGLEGSIIQRRASVDVQQVESAETNLTLVQEPLQLSEQGLPTGEIKRSESPSGHGLSIILDGVDGDTDKSLEGSSIQRSSETEEPSIETKDSFTEGVSSEQSSFTVELTVPEQGLPIGEKTRSDSPSGLEPSIILDSVVGDTVKGLEGSIIQRRASVNVQQEESAETYQTLIQEPFQVSVDNAYETEKAAPKLLEETKELQKMQDKSEIPKEDANSFQEELMTKEHFIIDQPALYVQPILTENEDGMVHQNPDETEVIVEKNIYEREKPEKNSSLESYCRIENSPMEVNPMKQRKHLEPVEPSESVELLDDPMHSESGTSPLDMAATVDYVSMSVESNKREMVEHVGFSCSRDQAAHFPDVARLSAGGTLTKRGAFDKSELGETSEIFTDTDHCTLTNHSGGIDEPEDIQIGQVLSPGEQIPGKPEKNSSLESYCRIENSPMEVNPIKQRKHLEPVEPSESVELLDDPMHSESETSPLDMAATVDYASMSVESNKREMVKHVGFSCSKDRAAHFPDVARLSAGGALTKRGAFDKSELGETSEIFTDIDHCTLTNHSGGIDEPEDIQIGQVLSPGEQIPEELNNVIKYGLTSVQRVKSPARLTTMQREKPQGMQRGAFDADKIDETDRNVYQELTWDKFERIEKDKGVDDQPNSSERYQGSNVPDTSIINHSSMPNDGNLGEYFSKHADLLGESLEANHNLGCPDTKEHSGTFSENGDCCHPDYSMQNRGEEFSSLFATPEAISSAKEKTLFYSHKGEISSDITPVERTISIKKDEHSCLSHVVFSMNEQGEAGRPETSLLDSTQDAQEDSCHSRSGQLDIKDKAFGVPEFVDDLSPCNETDLDPLCCDIIKDDSEMTVLLESGPNEYKALVGHEDDVMKQEGDVTMENTELDTRVVDPHSLICYPSVGLRECDVTFVGNLSTRADTADCVLHSDSVNDAEIMDVIETSLEKSPEINDTDDAGREQNESTEQEDNEEKEWVHSTVRNVMLDIQDPEEIQSYINKPDLELAESSHTVDFYTDSGSAIKSCEASIDPLFPEILLNDIFEQELREYTDEIYSKMKNDDLSIEDLNQKPSNPKDFLQGLKTVEVSSDLSAENSSLRIEDAGDTLHMDRLPEAATNQGALVQHFAVEVEETTTAADADSASQVLTDSVEREHDEEKDTRDLAEISINSSLAATDQGDTLHVDLFPDAATNQGTLVGHFAVEVEETTTAADADSASQELMDSIEREHVEEKDTRDMADIPINSSLAATNQGETLHVDWLQEAATSQGALVEHFAVKVVVTTNAADADSASQEMSSVAAKEGTTEEETQISADIFCDQVNELKAEHLVSSELEGGDVADTCEHIHLECNELLSPRIGNICHALHLEMATNKGEQPSVVVCGGIDKAELEKPADSHGKLISKTIKEFDGALEDDVVSQRKSNLMKCQETEGKVRTILIHGTPNRVQMRGGDMKENMASSKLEKIGNLTTVRPAKKRTALTQHQKK